MKVVYLDQFVMRKCFCPDANEPHSAFFGRVASICTDLVRKQKAFFPFSESHLRETSTVRDPAHRESLINGFQVLSNGFQFIPHGRILGKQAKALLSLSSYSVDWSPRQVLLSDGLMDFRRQLDSTDAPERKKHHESLKQLFLWWQKMPKEMFDSIAQREADTYADLLLRDLATMLRSGPTEALKLLETPHYDVFNELYWTAEQNGSKDPMNEALVFIRDRAMEIPSVRLASELWASFATSRRRDLDKAKDPANMAEDIHFVSCFVPYCDAAFLDNGMASLLGASKLLVDHKTAIFSLNQQSEFLSYLAT